MHIYLSAVLASLNDINVVPCDAASSLYAVLYFNISALRSSSFSSSWPFSLLSRALPSVAFLTIWFRHAEETMRKDEPTVCMWPAIDDLAEGWCHDRLCAGTTCRQWRVGGSYRESHFNYSPHNCVVVHHISDRDIIRAYLSIKITHPDCNVALRKLFLMGFLRNTALLKYS